MDYNESLPEIMSYVKIQNNLAPPYLVEACPPLVGTVSNYNLRNTENISLPRGSRTGYVTSFFPSAVRAWNKLDVGLRNRTSIDSFKYNLKKSKSRKKNKLYSKFNGSRAVNHARMRMGLSGLKAQRHAYNHVDHSTCDFCGSKREDAMHYFLQCRAFANMRPVLLEGVTQLYHSINIGFDLSRTLVKKELTSYLLKGDKRLDTRQNTELFTLVQNFIYSSKRF